MNCIASWSFEPWLKGKSTSWQSTSDFLAAAKASLELVAKNYSRPIVYTDSLGKHIFSKITQSADFEVLYDNLYDDLNVDLWSYPKILTYSQQTKPFFHFDLDFLCLKTFPIEWFDCDLLIQNFENLKDCEEFVLQFYNLPTVQNSYILPPEMIYEDPNLIFSANLGCMWMNNMSLNKTYTELVKNFVNVNKSVINKGPTVSSSVIEQHILGMIINQTEQLKIHTLLPVGWFIPPVTEYFVHFVGPDYKKSHQSGVALRQQFLDPWKDQTVIDLAQELDNILV